MVDQDTRSAAKVAALVAVPVALLTGIGLVVLLSGTFAEPAAQQPATPSPSPTAAPDPDTGPVATELRELTDREETVCRALLSQLPDTIGGLAQRPVTDGPEQNAAYGDPAVAVACGTPEADYAPTDRVYPLSPGVCWHAAEEPDATEWTTLDREVPVRVTVPATYDGPGQLVTELSGTVLETVRSADTAPSGCD